MVQSGGTAVAGCDVPGAGLGAHMVLWKHPIVKSELHTRALLGSRDSVPLRLKKKLQDLVKLKGNVQQKTVDPHLFLLSFVPFWWKEPLSGLEPEWTVCSLRPSSCIGPAPGSVAGQCPSWGENPLHFVPQPLKQFK